MFCKVCEAEAADGKILCQRCFSFWFNFENGLKPLQRDHLNTNQIMKLILTSEEEVFLKKGEKNEPRGKQGNGLSLALSGSQRENTARD
jgi:hypothetical protein